jgi:hypothetical protein
MAPSAGLAWALSWFWAWTVAREAVISVIRSVIRATSHTAFFVEDFIVISFKKLLRALTASSTP